MLEYSQEHIGISWAENNRLNLRQGIKAITIMDTFPKAAVMSLYSYQQQHLGEYTSLTITLIALQYCGGDTVK
jgi:hypothetical protein